MRLDFNKKPDNIVIKSEVLWTDGGSLSIEVYIGYPGEDGSEMIPPNSILAIAIKNTNNKT